MLIKCLINYILYVNFMFIRILYSIHNHISHYTTRTIVLHFPDRRRIKCYQKWYFMLIVIRESEREREHSSVVKSVQHISRTLTMLLELPWYKIEV